MAKIHEEVIVIKLSTLVKDGSDNGRIASAEVAATLEQVAQELVGAGVVVEVEQA